MGETYAYSGWCDNCERLVQVQIPKGVGVIDYFNKDKEPVECPRCKCKVLRRKKW